MVVLADREENLSQQYALATKAKLRQQERGQQ